MCGIVGIAGKITHQAKNVVFKDFLDVCQVRGRDSTGVIKVRDDRTSRTHGLSLLAHLLVCLISVSMRRRLNEVTLLLL